MNIVFKDICVLVAVLISITFVLNIFKFTVAHNKIKTNEFYTNSMLLEIIRSLQTFNVIFFSVNFVLTLSLILIVEM